MQNAPTHFYLNKSISLQIPFGETVARCRVCDTTAFGLPLTNYPPPRLLITQ